MNENERSSFPLNSLEEIKDSEDVDLSVILNKTWHIHSVSALFNCKLDDDVELNKYGKKLREMLAQRLPKEDCSYSANFKVLEDLNFPNFKESSGPLQVEVTATKNEKQAIVYTGIILSWGSINHSTFKDSLNMTLLLCKGTIRTMDTTNQILTEMFDCMIVPMPVTATDMKWLMSIAMKTFKKDSEGDLVIDYTIPGHPDTDHIILTYKISETVSLMERILSKRKNQLTSNDVELLIQYLQQPVLVNAGLTIQRLNIQKITLPTFALEGKRLKVVNADLLNAVLIYFHDKTVQELYDLSYRLSVSNVHKARQ